MKKAIIINGFGGVGKDTFIDILRSEFNYNHQGQTIYDAKWNIESFSSVDKVKEAAKILGWDGVTKDLKSRRFLHDLKNLVTEYNDGCLLYMKTTFERIHDSDYLIDLIFFHIREPKEIDKAKEALNAIVIYVKNDNVLRNDHNLEDKDIENYPYDYIVNNFGTLEDLKIEAHKFIEWIGKQINEKE